MANNLTGYSDRDKEIEAARLILLNADIAAQTRNGDKALRLLDELKVEELPLNLQAGYWGIEGEALFRVARYEEARQSLERALQLYRQVEVDVASPLQIAQLRNILAGTYYQQNQPQKALDLHKLCLQAVLDGYITDSRFKLKLYNNLGNENLFLGQLNAALEYYQEAIKLAVAGEDDHDQANVYWGAGITYRQLGQYPQAKSHLKKSLKFYRRAKEWYFVPGVRNTLGWVLTELGAYEPALKELELGLKEATDQTKNFHDQALLNLNLAYLYFKQGQFQTALPYAGAALELARSVGNQMTLGLVLAQLAEIRLELGAEITEVKELFREGLETLKQTTNLEITRRLYKRYALALQKAGLIEEAFEELIKALDFFDKSQPPGMG